MESCCVLKLIVGALSALLSYAFPVLCTVPVAACCSAQFEQYCTPNPANAAALSCYPHAARNCCCRLIPPASATLLTDLLRNFDQLSPDQLEAQYQQLVGEFKHRSSASTAADKAAVKADKAAKAAAAATEDDDADEQQQQQQQEQEQQESTLWGM
jgi:hypothetical protein